MRLVPLGVWAVSTAGETTSFLLDSSAFAFLIDTGLNPAYHLARAGKPLTQVSDVFLSHCHSDHISGFANFVFSRQVAERTEGTAAPLRVWGLDSVLHVGRQMLALQYPDRQFELSWRPCTSHSTASESGFAVSFAEVEHSVPGLAIRITEESTSQTLCYTSDTALLDSLSDFCMGADLLLGECFGTEEKFGQVMSAQKHMSTKDLAALATSSAAKKVVLFHMHQPYVADEARQQLVADIATGFSGEIVFPTPLVPIEA